MAEHLAHAAHDDHDHKPHGWRRWVYSTNHKDIGTMYLIFACTMFFVGGAMAMVIRLELFKPGMQFVDPQFFNSMTTMHALVMIFGAVMPAWTGLANWMIPMQLGAPDMALPRLNNFSFWILPFAFTLLLSSLFVPGGAPAGGWTMYPPLVLQNGASFPMLIFAVHMMGASSILGAINVVVTIMNLRAPGMTLLRMPLFVWTWLITAYLLIAVMPVLAGAVTMLLTDHFFGTTFFTSSCRPSASSRRSSPRSRASRCLATRPWCTRWPRSPSCPSSCGRTTCSPSACRSRGSCSSCSRPC